MGRHLRPLVLKIDRALRGERGRPTLHDPRSGDGERTRLEALGAHALLSVRHSRVEPEHGRRRIEERPGAGHRRRRSEPRPPTRRQPARERARGRQPAQGIRDRIGEHRRAFAGQAPENGVDEAGCARGRLSGQLHRFGDGGPRRHAQVHQLIRAQAQDRLQRSFESREGAVEQTRTGEVQRGAAAQRAEHQLVKEGPVASGEPLDVVGREPVRQGGAPALRVEENAEGDLARCRGHPPIRAARPA